MPVNDYARTKTTIMYKGRRVEIRDFERKTFQDGRVEYRCSYNDMVFVSSDLSNLRLQLEEVLDNELGQLF